MAKDIKQEKDSVSLSKNGIRVLAALCFSSALSACGGHISSVDTQVVPPPDVNFADIAEADKKFVSAHHAPRHLKHRVKTHVKPKAHPARDVEDYKPQHDKWIVKHNAKGEVLYYPVKKHAEVFGPAMPPQLTSEAKQKKSVANTNKAHDSAIIIAPKAVAADSTINSSKTIQVNKKDTAIADAKVSRVDSIKNSNASMEDKSESTKATAVEKKSQITSSVEATKSLDKQGPNLVQSGKFLWPVHGEVKKQFLDTDKQDVKSINILVPVGTPVHAAEDGIVIYSGNGLKEFGNIVLIKHENNIVTVYGNNSKLQVEHGQHVKKGDIIALSGRSGQVDEPGVHFEVRDNLKPVDPMSFLDITAK